MIFLFCCGRFACMKPARPFTKLDWQRTPVPVHQYIVYLEQTVMQLQNRRQQIEKRLEALEVKSKKTSRKSSKAAMPTPAR